MTDSLAARAAAVRAQLDTAWNPPPDGPGDGSAADQFADAILRPSLALRVAVVELAELVAELAATVDAAE